MPTCLALWPSAPPRLSVETVCADARTFELGRADFDLCLLPMQTVQLLGGSTERIAALRRARAHLRPGGLVALAIVTAVEPFDCTEGDFGPSPELARVDGTLYSSRATRVCVLAESILIERERGTGPERVSAPAEQPDERLPGAEWRSERNVVELHPLEASQLEGEGLQAGLHRDSIRMLGPTDDHVGSTVVILRA